MNAQAGCKGEERAAGQVCVCLCVEEEEWGGEHSNILSRGSIDHQYYKKSGACAATQNFIQ